MGGDGVSRQVRIGGRSLALFLTAPLVIITPAAAQNGCQAALTQVQQARTAIIAKNQADQNTLTTNRIAAQRECMNKAQPNNAESGKAADSCLRDINSTYDAAVTALDNERDHALTQEANVEGSIAFGKICNWTPEELTQFLTAVGQATAQMGQSAAQIITAAKTKAAAPSGASAANAAASKPPATSTTPAPETPTPGKQSSPPK